VHIEEVGETMNETIEKEEVVEVPRVLLWWEEAKGFCVALTTEPYIYVFGTKRSQLTYAEKVLDGLSKGQE
jgi:hypothetical protein